MEVYSLTLARLSDESLESKICWPPSKISPSVYDVCPFNGFLRTVVGFIYESENTIRKCILDYYVDQSCSIVSFLSHVQQDMKLKIPYGEKRQSPEVLFSEQVKMRAAMREKEPAQSGINSEQDGNQISATMDIKALKAELENVKSKMVELQSHYFELQQEYEKLSNKPKNLSGWSFGWRKIKNYLHTKPAGVETGDGQDIPKSPMPTHRRGTPRRRLSMS